MSSKQATVIIVSDAERSLMSELASSLDGYLSTGDMADEAVIQNMIETLQELANRPGLPVTFGAPPEGKKPDGRSVRARPDKPEKIRIGEVHARPIRPRGARGTQDGRWYWRAEVFTGEDGKSRTVWTGWATREEAIAAISLAGAGVDDGGKPRTINPAKWLRIRPVRGPHADDEALWYWRAEHYMKSTQKRKTVWAGWATREEAEQQGIEIVAAGDGEE
jgi:hypothetical protein